jgi:hypothetical protein
MKEIIRNILIEETEGTKDPEVIKDGVRAAVKIVKREYPFVVGVDFISQWNSPLYIKVNIVCDIDKVAEFYKAEVSVKRSYAKRELFAYQFSVLDLSQQLTSKEKFAEFVKFQTYLNEVYSVVPDDLKEFNKWGEPKEIEVEEFRFV